MVDEALLWDLLEHAWQRSTARARLRDGEPCSQDEWQRALEAVVDELIALPELLLESVLLAWRRNARVLYDTRRSFGEQQAYFIVALGQQAFESALEGRANLPRDPSGGGFARVVAALD